NNPNASVQMLYQHQNPIMHLCKIKNTIGEEYLVSGSYYPSIKIYDLKSKEKKVIKTIHNRFLLGSEGNKLIYARIHEGKRSKTALGRWLQSGLDKEYICTLCTLDDPSFNKDNEAPKDDDEEPSIRITQKQYPISIANDEITFIFDPQTNKQLYPGKNFDVAIPNMILMNRELTEDENKKESPTNFLRKSETWKYFTSLITHNNFIEFAYKNPTKNVAAYIYDKMQHIVDLCIQSRDATIQSRDNISAKKTLIKELTSHFIKKLEEKGYNNTKSIQNMPFEENTLLNLKQIAQEHWHENKALHIILDFEHKSSSAKFYHIDYKKNNIKSAYLDDTNITFLTKTDIWTGTTTLENKDLNMYAIMGMEACNIQEKNIHNIFSIGSTIYYFAQNKDDEDEHMYLFAKTTNQTVQTDLFAKDLYPQQNISDIRNILEELSNASSISALKKAFQEQETFFVNAPTDIKHTISDENLILNMLRHDYVDHVLRNWIKPIAEKYSAKIEHLKNNIISTLVNIFSEHLIEHDIRSLNQEIEKFINAYLKTSVIPFLQAESVLYKNWSALENNQNFVKRFNLNQNTEPENFQLLKVYHMLESELIYQYTPTMSIQHRYLKACKKNITEQLKNNPLFKVDPKELLHLVMRPNNE
ncbi:MAG TPA: hypothetical protein VL201_05900, partial [Patescibacteria group bacterium]|nr:hypothetical protein [Patescibacteria group bacterium]